MIYGFFIFIFLAIVFLRGYKKLKGIYEFYLRSIFLFLVIKDFYVVIEYCDVIFLNNKVLEVIREFLFF